MLDAIMIPSLHSIIPVVRVDLVALVFLLSGWVSACNLQSDHDRGRVTADAVINPTGAVVVNETVPLIIAFGNSLTAGLGVSPSETYPAQLQQKIIQLDLPHRVVNMGVSGETTAGAVRRLNQVIALQPSIVILEFGANDGLRGLDVEQTKGNLTQTIDRLQADGITVVLVGMQLPPNYGPAYTRQFAQIFHALATTYRLPFMSFFLEGVATNPALNQPDGIHPNAEGYAVVVDNLWPVLLPLLEQQ